MKKKLFVVLSLITMILFSANLYAQKGGAFRVGFQLGGYLPPEHSLKKDLKDLYDQYFDKLGEYLPPERWSDVVSNGIGVSVLYNHKIISTISITGTIGYYTFPSKQDVGEAIGSVGDFSYVISPILAGLRVGLVHDDQAFQPYVGFDLGVFLTSYQYKEKQSTGTYGTVIASPYGSSLFGFAPAVGFRLRIGSNVDLDVNTKWNIAKDINHLGLNLGVLFSN